jgi:hypothetical protein
MTPDELDALIADLIDEEYRRRPNGDKTAEVEEAVRDRVRAALPDLDRDLDAEAAARIHAIAAAQRRERRQALRTNVAYILDGIPEDGTYVDPLLDLAYPLGTTDGMVKTLRYWTRDDFRTSVQMAYRKSADATAAARAWDEVATRAVEAMQAHGWVAFGGSS